MGAMVERYGQDAYLGGLFAFVSRRGDRLKILYWDNGGFVLWYKILEKGRFRLPLQKPGQEAVHLDATELAMLMDGIDFSRVRRPQKWQPPKKQHKGIDKGPRL